MVFGTGIAKFDGFQVTFEWPGGWNNHRPMTPSVRQPMFAAVDGLVLTDLRQAAEYNLDRTREFGRS